MIDKKSLIETKHNQISVSEQCELVGMSRSSFYYKPVPMSQKDIQLLHKIDEIATDNSEYGYRYIINDGFMYFVAVMDWHSKAVFAYKISNSMDATLATDVLQEALQKYPKPKIFNSDQGSQYTSYEHIQLLKKHDIQISMNDRGRSIDNIVIERFFRTLKHGNIYISDYQSIKELKEGVKSYIHKYNFKRFHSGLNYQKPMNVYLEYLKNVA